MSLIRQLIEEFKRPVVASESLDARPAPAEREAWDEPATATAVAVIDDDRVPAELRHGY